MSLDRETVASYTLILEAIGKDSQGSHGATEPQGVAMHVLSSLAGVSEGQQPPRHSASQGLCLVLALHSPCELTCPGSIMGVFSSQVCPAPGLSLSPRKGRLPVPEKLHTVQDSPLPKTKATASFPSSHASPWLCGC